MIYKIFITEGGAPKTGLSPTWSSLRTTGGVDKSAAGPAIQEIGGGWYKAEFTYGTSPFDVPELVGVIDAGATLGNTERYLPIVISLRDLALVKLVNKATYDVAGGVESIRNDTDTADELRIRLSQSGEVEIREILDS